MSAHDRKDSANQRTRKPARDSHDQRRNGEVVSPRRGQRTGLRSGGSSEPLPPLPPPPAFSRRRRLPLPAVPVVRAIRRKLAGHVIVRSECYFSRSGNPPPKPVGIRTAPRTWPYSFPNAFRAACAMSAPVFACPAIPQPPSGDSTIKI